MSTEDLHSALHPQRFEPFERTVKVDLLHVIRTEPIQGASQTGGDDGQGPSGLT